MDLLGHRARGSDDLLLAGDGDRQLERHEFLECAATVHEGVMPADTAAMHVEPRTSALPLVVGAAWVLAIDLSSKVAAIAHPHLLPSGMVYNPDMPSTATRLGVCATTVLVLACLTAAARRLRLGAIPLVWLAGGMLVGGTLGNWISGRIWKLGVPDFISHGDRMWNMADFSIGSGMLLAFVSMLGYAIRGYVRGRRRSRARESIPSGP
jgi:hypothetical protein